MATSRRPAAPRRRVVGPYSYLDSSRPIGFAHRGGAAAGDENSMAAFSRAVEAGYRYLETDAHVSRDGVAVLFHDRDLWRLTGDPALIADLTWPQLRRVTHRGQSLIPRLDEVLDAWPRTRFNIDVKSDAAVDPTLRAIEAAAARDRVLIGSFSDARLARVRRNSSPRQATSMGPRETARLWTASRLGRGLRGFVPRAPAVQVPMRLGAVPVVGPRFIDYAHHIGIDVHVWTIDDPDTMRRLLDWGVDGIMTDRINILADVYRSRGYWPPTP